MMASPCVSARIASTIEIGSGAVVSRVMAAMRALSWASQSRTSSIHARWSPGSIASTRTFKAALASATIGTAAGLTLCISEESISIWIMRARRKFAHFPRDAIVEAQPNANDQVSDADGPVDMRGTMHTRHTNGQGVCFGKGAQAKQRGDDRDIGFLGKGQQFVEGL